MLIGLTGQIGAGKTTAAMILKSLGASVIDADKIGREVVDRSPAIRNKLARRFGTDILDRRGNLKRQRLASMAFASEEARTALNSIVHPHLLKELRQQTRSARKTHEIVVIDAALLVFWQMDSEVDFVLVIHASRESRLKRMARRGISASDALARQRSQLSFRDFQQCADRVILNNGTESDLRRKLSTLIQKIRRTAYRTP
jgi:dephospho-CoA kinase